jgi:FKBP-type peptidyl-prolyl cis-trans isomerase 2
MAVKEGDKVKVNYAGRFSDGEVFDSSEGREPLEFTVGQGQVIPGFEQAVIGMEAGDSKTVVIPAMEGYGIRQEELILTVDRGQLPQNFEPEVGMQLQSQQPDGRPIFATITSIEETVLTLDANHPLAGRELTFDIELVEVG